jgi:protein tyrosine/serine phosphatase
MNEMETRLKDFDEKMNKLAARPRPKSEKARMEMEKTYYFLKAKRDELRNQLMSAEDDTDDGWHRFKAATEKVYEDMVRYMDETCAKIDGPENAGLY